MNILDSIEVPGRHGLFTGPFCVVVAMEKMLLKLLLCWQLSGLQAICSV